MSETKKRFRKKSVKVITMILAVIILLLLAIDLIVGNYLVSFAVGRKSSGGASVAPTPVITDATQEKVDANAKALSARIENWLKGTETEQAEIQSDDGLTLCGDIVMNAQEHHKWAIIVHGYTARRIWMYDYACIYAEQGYHVLLPDMRGHGESEGNYIGMGWLDRLDLLKWIDLICQRDADAEIVLHGVSMGGAAVLMTSGESLPPNVKAVVDDCGYTSVWDIFSDELDYLFGLPDFPFLYTANSICKVRAGYTFREASAIEQVRKTNVPVLFLHGSEDNFVHTDMVYQLYDACPAQKDIYVAQDAGHGQSFYINPQVYEDKVFGFLETVVN